MNWFSIKERCGTYTESLSMYKEASLLQQSAAGSKKHYLITGERSLVEKRAGIVTLLDKKLLEAAQKDTRVGRFLAGAIPGVVSSTAKANQALSRGSAGGAVAALSKGGTGAMTSGVGATSGTAKRLMHAHKKLKSVTGKVKKKAGHVTSGVDGLQEHASVDSPYLDYLSRAAGYVGDVAGEVADKVADNPRYQKQLGGLRKEASLYNAQYNYKQKGVQAFNPASNAKTRWQHGALGKLSRGEKPSFKNMLGLHDKQDWLGRAKTARAPRDYKREYGQYHSKPERVAERSTRNKARRKLGLTKGDPREVDHKIPLSRGGSNARSNLRAVSLVENRKKFTKTASNPRKASIS